jgi:phosphoribosyl 1,2-cyclic phosphodiesterase
MTACVLGSGSAGNCTYVASDTTAILVDAGLSGREIARRLAAASLDAAAIRAVCLTHEHGDHTAGLRALHKRQGVKLYANSRTVEALEDNPEFRDLEWNIFGVGAPFAIGDLRIEPFSVPHDAYDPVGFVIAAGAARLGIVTDMGMVTELIRQRLRDCRLLILEANHDERMVADAERPWVLKQRILSRQGHLSNRGAAELVQAVAGPLLEAVFLAHLSAECNEPGLAQQAVAAALAQAGCPRARVCLTYPDRSSDIWRG